MTSLATLMKVANDFSTGKEMARAGHRPLPGAKTNEPTLPGAEAPKSKSSKNREDRKRKEEQDSKLVAGANKTDEAGGKRQHWNNKQKRTPHSYDDIMNGHRVNHSHNNHKAQHSTRDYGLNEQLLHEKNNPAATHNESGNNAALPIPATHPEQQANGQTQRAFPKNIRRVDMVTEERRPPRRTC